MDISIAGKKVILYGAGGMGRGCSYALGQEVAREVVVLNRTPDRAEALASDSQALWPDTEFRSLQPVEESLAVGLERELATTDIFINASSVGQKGKGAADKSPLAGLNFRDLVVVESVYDPGTTPLVEQAYASECCPVIKGLDILIHQAIEQVYIYLGYSDQARANMPPSDRRALAKVMRHASRLELYEREQAKTPRGKVIAWEPHTT